MSERAAYEALCREILEHDRRYYVENDPSIADVEYDRLLARARAIEEAHPDWVVPWSPTRRVGHAPVSAFPKVTRAVPMLSLDNTYDEKELTAFHERVERHDPLPIGFVDEDDRKVGFLAGLAKRQKLEKLVERAEAARKHHECIRPHGEMHLAHREIMEVEAEFRRHVGVG